MSPSLQAPFQAFSLGECPLLLVTFLGRVPLRLKPNAGVVVIPEPVGIKTTGFRIDQL